MAEGLQASSLQSGVEPRINARRQTSSPEVRQTQPKVPAVPVRDSLGPEGPFMEQKTDGHEDGRMQRFGASSQESRPLQAHLFSFSKTLKISSQILIFPPSIWTFHVSHGAAGIGSFQEALLVDLQERENGRQSAGMEKTVVLMDTTASTSLHQPLTASNFNVLSSSFP